MIEIVPLSRLRAGETAEVIDLFGNDRLIAQLAERGLHKGCLLEVLRQGDPSLLRVGQTRLSWRHDGLVEVMVSLQNGQHSQAS